MKAEKKAAEKEAKVKEQVEQKKESNDQGAAQDACGMDEETLDPNVRFLYGHYTSSLSIPSMFWSFCIKSVVCFSLT